MIGTLSVYVGHFVNCVLLDMYNGLYIIITLYIGTYFVLDSHMYHEIFSKRLYEVCQSK